MVSSVQVEMYHTQLEIQALLLLTLYTRAKFSRGNKNICLHFMSFLHIDRAQVVEILTQVIQESTYSIVTDRAGIDPWSPIPEPNA